MLLWGRFKPADILSPSPTPAVALSAAALLAAALSAAASPAADSSVVAS